MDGLLIDSEILWHKAELEILSRLGVPISTSDGRGTKGLFVDDVVDYWYGRYRWNGPSPSEVATELMSRVGDLVESEGRLMPGALRALDLASAHGPIALASSTPLALIERCLAHFDLVDRFASIHSAQFEPYGKPHPGVFLSAAQSIGVRPARCLVFEDSSPGVLAAKAASMFVVAVPTAQDLDDPVFVLADVVLLSLDELSAAWMDEQFA